MLGDLKPVTNNGVSDSELIKYKVVFVGEQNVGKSSLISMFVRSEVPLGYMATIGIDFYSRNLEFDDKTVRLQIWDTAGQERFRSLIPSYLRDSDVAVIVYDVTNPASFARTQHWYEYVKRERGSEIVVILIANKCDLAGQRKITKNGGERLALGWKCRYMEVSALSADSVKDLFNTIALMVPEEKEKVSQEERIRLTSKEEDVDDEKTDCSC